MNAELQSSGDQPFSTSEKILAFCLYLAGCELIEGNPVVNLYDPEILFTIGGGTRKPKSTEVLKPSRFAGLTPWDAAHEAWKEHAEGHVEYQFILTQECHDLIKAYRNQREKMKTGDGKASGMVAEIMATAVAGGMLPAEAMLRIACVTVKTRPEFLQLWKEAVPILRVPVKGKSKTRDTTMVSHGKTVPVKEVTSPGWKSISLNANDRIREKLGI